MLPKRVPSLSSQRGQALLEVVMVAFILLMALVALISLTTVSIARNRLAKERSVATRLAQEGLEWLKYERDRAGFDAVASVLNTPYCISEFPAGGIEALPGGECGAGDYVDAGGLGNTFMRTVVFTVGPGFPVSEVRMAVTVAWRSVNAVTLEGVITRWER